MRNDEVLVTDAAFTESKEWIAGFDVLECDSMDEAVTSLRNIRWHGETYLRRRLAEVGEAP